MKFDKGYYDPEAGWKKDKDGKIILGVPEYKNLTKTGGKNGEVVFSETTDKSFKTYSTTLETLKAAYENAKTGKIPLDINGQPMQVKNEDGELVTIDADNLKKQIDDYTSQYSTFIKNVSSKEFNDWNNKQFNDPIIEDGKILKPTGEAPEPRYYWDSLLEAHRKGLLKENDLQSGREYIKATYHFDPYTYYGIE
ncbi:MAG: hypothetical protein IPJ03_16985 [Ignavibacteriales bacterium]|nr:hypothetical protein [Ignavibacteriales bacterium]